MFGRQHGESFPYEPESLLKLYGCYNNSPSAVCSCSINQKIHCSLSIICHVGFVLSSSINLGEHQSKGGIIVKPFVWKGKHCSHWMADISWRFMIFMYNDPGYWVKVCTGLTFFVHWFKKKKLLWKLIIVISIMRNAEMRHCLIAWSRVDSSLWIKLL